MIWREGCNEVNWSRGKKEKRGKGFSISADIDLWSCESIVLQGKHVSMWGWEDLDYGCRRSVLCGFGISKAYFIYELVVLCSTCKGNREIKKVNETMLYMVLALM